MTMKNNDHIVVSLKTIDDFKFCPFCGGEIMQNYIGDYTGYVQCMDCDDCEEKIDYLILEEMLDRYPKWIKEFKMEKGKLL